LETSGTQPGNRQGVGQFGDTDIALAPGQLTRVEHDDDQHEEGKCAAGLFDNLVGDRIGGGSIHISEVARRHHHEENAGHDDHGEVDVLALS
jgi:hypothetical protein